MEFVPAEVALDAGGSGRVALHNRGGATLGPIDFVISGVRDAAGNSVPGAFLSVVPSSVSTLNAGAVRQLDLQLTASNNLQPGPYDIGIDAVAGDGTRTVLDVRLDVAEGTLAARVSALRIVDPPSTARQGDVSALGVSALDEDGAPLSGVAVHWSVHPAHMGYVSSTGQFVGFEDGNARIVARAGLVADSVAITMEDRDVTLPLDLVGGTLREDRYTSDLWVHGSVAYSGTWGVRQTSGPPTAGNVLNVWSLSDPATPEWTGSIEVDARTVNDVKVREDGRLAVITHEGSNDGLNGITILDLADPLQPTVIGRFTEGLESGIHNTWIDGDFVYLVLDGLGNGMRVLSIENPASPRVVGRYYGGSSFLHDIYVREGLAFLAHWDAGLIILDVGHGAAGGSPSNPVEVSRIALDGEVHNAWYWPESGYVFVGEEDFSTPGRLHVVDIRNVLQPRAVADFQVDGETPHNFWLDEDRGILYAAWYTRGVQAVDVTGTLLGPLHRQGRVMASMQYGEKNAACRAPGGTCTWAPQLHRGLLYASDMNAGIVTLQPGS
jgi:hypothetical protein